VSQLDRERIAVDLEGVLADIHAAYLEEYNDTYDTDHSLEEVAGGNGWSWMNEMEGGFDVFMSITTQAWNGMADVEIYSLVENLRWPLLKLQRGGFTVDVVTNRIGVDDHVENWLADHNVPYDDLICTPMDKGEMGYDIYVDDNPHLRKSIPDGAHQYYITHPWNIDEYWSNTTHCPSITEVSKQILQDYSIGVGVVGYPGTGKSSVGEYLAADIGIDYGNHSEGDSSAVLIGTGDLVRRMAAEHFGIEDTTELSSDELGDYSTDRRNEDGGDYVGQDVISVLDEKPQFPDQPVIISGMRDTEVPELFREYFGTFVILWVQSDFSDRLSRLQDRGRQDESEFTPSALMNRDSRERDWGIGDLVRQCDVMVRNDSSIEDLRSRSVNGVLEHIRTGRHVSVRD